MMMTKLKVPAPALLVIALLAAGLAGLCLCPSVRSDQGEELAADIKALKNAGVGADESGLLEFFKKQTVSDARRRNIGELIKQLGDNRFRVRETATRELKAMGTARQLGSLYLVTAQTPSGPTAHEIWVSAEPIGDDRTKAKLVHTFKGQTHDGDLLHFEFPKRLSGRYVQIRTTESPSWVAWSEIELGVR